MDNTDTTTNSIPMALRHLLSKGGMMQSGQIDDPSNGIVHNPSPFPRSTKALPIPPSQPLPKPATDSDTATATATATATRKVNSASSQATLRPSNANSASGGGLGLGTWLSKYHLRSGGTSRSSLSSNASTVAASLSSRSSLDGGRTHGARSSAPQARGPAYAAYITSVETRDQSGNSGLRGIGRRHVMYRILVSGRTGQWWVSRRYSEFSDLYSALKQQYPKAAAEWPDFPSKRVIPSLNTSSDATAQRRDKLNAFLRAITNDTDICPCGPIQRFLHQDDDGYKEYYGTSYDANARGMQVDMESTTAGRSMLNAAGNGDTGASLHNYNRLPLPEEWSRNSPAHADIAISPSGRKSGHVSGRDSIERMSSLPTLKGAQSYMDRQGNATVAGQVSVPGNGGEPTSPYPPYSPYGLEHKCLSPIMMDDSGMASNADIQTQHLQQLQQQQQALQRKTSDPLMYTSTDKRASPRPPAVRKKYGLRDNMQYLDEPGAEGAIPAPCANGTNMPLMDRLELTQAAAHARGKVADMRWNISENDSNTNTSGESANEMSDVEMMDTTSPTQTDSTRSDSAMQCTMVRRDSAMLQSPRLVGSQNGVSKCRQMPDDDPAVAQEREHMRMQRRLSGVMAENMIQSSLATVVNGNSAPCTDEKSAYVITPPRKKISLDDFHLLSIIGKGSYGKVMLARYKDTGKVMAIKVISKSKLHGRPNEIRRVMSERRVLERTVQHPFLVGLQCAFQTKAKLYFCIDYVNGGELFFHLQSERRFAENRARFYAAEITSALAYLHGMDVVYRDLKPENCLLDARGHVRIVDFGLAKEVGPIVWRSEGTALYSVEEGGKTTTFCGTPEYLAPEVLLRQSYGKEVDWYCLGAVLYEMLTGLPPFYDQDNNKMYRRILQEPLRFPASLPPVVQPNGATQGSAPANSVGRLAQDFIFRLMDRDPSRRLGYGVFGTENVKRHSFFYGIDWGKIYRQEYAPPFVPKVSSIFDLSNIDPEFRNEPIPESILAEGQVDLLAEAAEAERKQELEQHAKLPQFPNNPSAPAGTANGMFDGNKRVNNDGEKQNGGYGGAQQNPSAPSGAKNNKGAGNSVDADEFKGFSFVSPWVDEPEEHIK